MLGSLSKINQPNSVHSFKREFAELLLEWWQSNKRDFPWRRTNDPYKILIAELLLRKTTARQVSNLFEKFLVSFPDAKALSKAQENEIKDLIKPLGMEHKRAPLLKKLASDLARKYSGQIPQSENDLISLPGVGRYVANAVLCFAYGKDVPLVDTNVVRVFQRVFDFKSQKRRIKDDPTFWEFVAEAIPSGRARDFNLAVIDFANKVCKPRKPNCTECPLQAICKYRVLLAERK
jgi:A/G-specific adenine glycosylase